MRFSSHLHAVTAVAFVVAASLVPQLASAADAPPQPPIDPAIAVYVEQIPTGSGSVASSRPSGPQAKVPSVIAARLRARGGADTAALEELVTSSGLGAPSPTAITQARQAAPVFGASSAWRDERLLGLVVALLFVTAGALVARVRQRGEGRLTGQFGARSAPDWPARS